MDNQLLERYISGDVTYEEKARVAEWLDENPENMREFLILRKLYDITVWQNAADVNPDKKPAGKKAGSLAGKVAFEILKVAAIFVLVFFAMRYLFPAVSEPKEIFATHTIRVPAGQHAELELADGSKVWLNAGTSFIFPERFSSASREVQLDGEAYFDVEKDEARPFVVHTGRYDIKVLGTEFNVTAYSTDKLFETSLIEGSIELLRAGNTEGMIVQPNERIYLENDRLIRGTIDNYNEFLWKEGLISFNNESFPEMISKLEHYFDVGITVKNEKILAYRCTGKFRVKDGVRHILRVLQLNNDFKFEIDDIQNTITIE